MKVEAVLKFERSLNLYLFVSFQLLQFSFISR